MQVDEGAQGTTGGRCCGLAVVAQLFSQNLAHEVTGGQSGENHGHRNDPAVESAGAGEGIVCRVQQEREQSCHVHRGQHGWNRPHGRATHRRGGCTGHASNLTVSRVQAVTEGEE